MLERIASAKPRVFRKALATSNRDSKTAGAMVDRPPRVPVEAVPDQYVDGKAARHKACLGYRQCRTDQYRQWITDLLRSYGCRTVLDAACGTGVDSIMLVEEGFKVFSTDASDKMLKYALKERWNRRTDPSFDQWIIEEGNWLTLVEDIAEITKQLPVQSAVDKQFDAVVCLGNSLSLLPNTDGNMDSHRLSIHNFLQLVKPGGILVIDHRNYDDILATGTVPTSCAFYNSDPTLKIECSTQLVNGKPNVLTMDCYMDASIMSKETGITLPGESADNHFSFSFYPLRLDEFTQLVRELSGPQATHTTFGDFKPVGEVIAPAFYTHVIKKPL